MVDDAGCRREGEGDAARLVMRVNGKTPDRCVRCNQPAGGFRKPAKFGERVSSYTGADANVFALVALVLLVFEVWTRKSGVVHMAVCQRCRGRQRTMRLCGTLLGLVGLGFLVGGIVLAVTQRRQNFPAIIGCLAGGVVVALIGLFWGSSGSPFPHLERIEGGELWFSKVNAEFLADLPGADAPAGTRR